MFPLRVPREFRLFGLSGKQMPVEAANSDEIRALLFPTDCPEYQSNSRKAERRHSLGNSNVMLLEHPLEATGR